MSQVTFRDTDGNDIAPWRVRAGSMITETRYSADDGALLCTVILGNGSKVLGDALAWIQSEHERRMKASVSPDG